jgi:Concanavalin A-like lectin/glucanases superfamily
VKKKTILYVLFFSILICPASLYAEMQIDIGNGTASTAVQAGWTGMQSTGPIDGNGLETVSVTVADAFGAGLDGTVSLTANRWKYRSAITGTYASDSDLLHDFGGPVGDPAVPPTNATLSLTLPVGIYEITLYHHEASRSAPESSWLTVTDADGVRPQETVTCSYGTEPAAIDTYTAFIRSNGSDAITFYYDNTEDDSTSAFPINGLEIYYSSTPQVDAGTFQSALVDTMTQLDATVIDDGQPAPLTYTWSRLSGPGTATFSPNPNIEDPCVIFNEVGVYELRLRAYDGEEDACDVLTVHVRATDDPVAHWDFETGDGTNVVDRTVNNNFGTFAGDPEPNWVAGWVGDWALEVAENSYVTITTDLAMDPNLNTMYGAVTVSTWVKVDSWPTTAWTGIVTKGHDHDGVEGDGGWQLIRNQLGDSLIFHAANAGLVYGSESVGDGYWHHVAGVHNGTTISLYVDGLLDTSEAAYGLVKPNTDDIWINGNSDEGTRFFDGEIDDVQVYDYGLSAAEITDLAAMGALIPRVDAGADETFSIIQSDYLQLDATVTDDGKPEAATLEWTSDPCNPGTVDFSNTAIEDPCAIFSTAGTYILRLTANDTMAQIYDEVTIEAENPTCLNVIDDELLIIGDISGPDGTPDCYVNLYDFAEFAVYWIRCNDPQDLECEFPY